MTRDLETEIEGLLKGTREQYEVVGPLVKYLLNLGWNLNQMRFGKQEWRVPKNPSEANRREKGQSFDGFSCDIVVFDSPERRDDPMHVLMIIETKAPDQDTGVSQLESYMVLEPHAKLGIWTNGADPSQPAVFVYRTKNGTFLRRKRPLCTLPSPGEPIGEEYKRLTFADLEVPTSETLKRVFEYLLDRIVVEDSYVTRREEQLDQLCNLILLKLHSDKLARMNPGEGPLFRVLESPARTAEHIRKAFQDFVNVYPETFTTQQDRELRLGDRTIYQCVAELAPYRLIDAGVETVALAFQVLRTAALRSEEGQYFTPYPVIRAGVKLLQVNLTDIVIDPACGTGGFLLEVLLEMNRRYPGREAELSRWAQTNIYGIDKDAIAVKLTKSIMQIAGDGSAHVVRGDTIRKHLWPREYPHLASGAFSDGRFTVVVTNPPFGQNLKVSAEDLRLSGLDIGSRNGGEYRDLEIGLVFLQRAHQLLRPGGRVGIVLPETYFFSPSYHFVFDWLKSRLKPVVVANVPMEAFQGFCRAKTNFFVFRKVG